MRGTKTIAFNNVTDEEFEIIKVRCHEIADEIGVSRDNKKAKLNKISELTNWLTDYANGDAKLVDGSGITVDEPSYALIAYKLSVLAKMVNEL